MRDSVPILNYAELSNSTGPRVAAGISRKKHVSFLCSANLKVNATLGFSRCASQNSS